jgi:hypothetical protein
LKIKDLEIKNAHLDELVKMTSIQADPKIISSAMQKLYNLHASLGHCSLQTLRSAVEMDI